LLAGMSSKGISTAKKVWSGRDADLAAKLRALAERVRRNVPLRRDPERFHVEKSCICQDLEHLAEQFERPTDPQITVSRQRRTITSEVIGGRRVTVKHKREPFFTSTR
jgi:uncharacterized protein (DUF2252 family)